MSESSGEIPLTQRRETGANETTSSRENKLTRRQFLQLGLLGTLSVVLGRFVERMERISTLSSPEKFTDPLANTIREIQKEFPETDWRADPKKWARAIRDGFNKVELPQTPENLAIVLTLIKVSSGFREVAPVYGEVPSPPETAFSVLKEQWTAGPMEVNYEYVMKLENIGKEEAMRRLNTLEYGVYYGIRMLKDVLTYYEGIPDKELRLQCVFADWNAGIGRSVRAGFQKAVSELTWIPLKETGLLLLEDESGKVPVIDTMMKSNSLFGLSQEKIRGDLEKPTEDLIKSDTWKKVEEVLGHPIQPVPADVEVPGIVGVAKEVILNEGSSREYAGQRLKEYKIIENILDSHLDYNQNLIISNQ